MGDDKEASDAVIPGTNEAMAINEATESMENEEGEIAPEVILHFNQMIERFKQEVSSARKQAIDSLERYQRIMADFDNYRKRVEKEKTEYFDNGARASVEKLLPCIDNFERALSAKADKDDIFFKGVEMIYRQLCDVIISLGAEEIHAMGQTFDPSRHEAIAHIQDDVYGENLVVEELRKGYMFKDRVIRPSMVKVAN